MNIIGGLLVFLGIPTAICVAAGTFHGRRAGDAWGKVILGAFLVSGITCWSFISGGEGDMPLPGILPSWYLSPLGPLAGPREFIFPPWWLTPWLPFIAYITAARYVGRLHRT
jgi:hypothetical protein